MKIESANALRPRVIGIAAVYLGLAMMVFFLAFCNLDGRLFWGDEAETAVLAKNILKFGIPRVDDGVNHISVNGYRYDERNGIWTWSPWLPQYLTAASLAVFGPDTWAGRAPFAFIGWLSVVVLGVVAWKIYRSHRVALACMLLLGTSEVFLLHIRQCRYYSIIVLGEILVVYGMYQALAKNKAGPWFILTGLLLQFYCTYISALANVPVLLVLLFNLFRQKNSARYPLIIALGTWVMLSLPWLLYTEAWRQESAETHATFLYFVQFYSSQFHFHFLPWCVVLLPAGGWLFHRFSRDPSITRQLPYDLSRFEKYLVLLMLLYLPVLGIVPLVYSRYLLPLLPVAILLAAVWLFRYIRWTGVAVMVLILQCTTNIFAVASAPFGHHPWRSPLADFVRSSMQPYDDRFSDVLKFLKPQIQPGDVLVSWDPELPLVFYTPVKLADARLTGPPSNRLPDWILPQSASGLLDQPPVPLQDLFKPYYETIILTVHNSPRSGNLPEPDYYQYQSAKAASSFVIYRLKKDASVEKTPSVKP